MYRYFSVIVLGAVLAPPMALGAQEHDRQDNGQNSQKSRSYEDKAHNDSHQWNQSEEQAYRRYLQEHHKKYHDFAKASKKEQNDYWNWRHQNPDNGRR